MFPRRPLPDNLLLSLAWLILQVVVKDGKAYIKDSTGAEAEVVEADITAGDASECRLSLPPFDNLSFSVSVAVAIYPNSVQE